MHPFALILVCTVMLLPFVIGTALDLAADERRYWKARRKQWNAEFDAANPHP